MASQATAEQDGVVGMVQKKYSVAAFRASYAIELLDEEAQGRCVYSPTHQPVLAYLHIYVSTY